MASGLPTAELKGSRRDRMDTTCYGDIQMAPGRRSVGFDIPFGPRTMKRVPESQVREIPIPKTRGRSKKLTLGMKFGDFDRPIKVQRAQPKSTPKHAGPALVDPPYVESREPSRRPSPDDFVPLPPPLSSPRHRLGEEAHFIEMRSPRDTRILHRQLPSVRRRYNQRPAPYLSPSPVREVETIRIRRLGEADRSRAKRHRAPNAEEETRAERRRCHNLEAHRRYLEEIALEERAAHRRTKDATANLRRENERLDRQQRLADREAAVLERERKRERERVRQAFGRPQDDLRPEREGEVVRPTTDRGADVIRAAQARGRARRREPIYYYGGGKRMEQVRYY